MQAATRLLTVLLLLLIATTGYAQASGGELQPSRLRWLVVFEEETEPGELAALARQWGGTIFDPGPYARHHVLQFQMPPEEEIISQILSEPRVKYLEREARFATTSYRRIPGANDPLRQNQWSLEMIRLEQAYLINFGSDPGVTVAILDSGVAYADSDRFAAAADLEGTIVYPGFDFVAGDEEPLDEGDGRIGHGTMMAGIISQTTFNSRGTAGIAFNASLLPVRVVNRKGIARASDVARGIRYAVVSGASVIVAGFSGSDESRVVDEAIAFADSRNVPVIAPAGNSVEVGYPARHPLVLSVGALDAGGQRAYYSPTGGPVDIYAPGGDMRQGVDVNDDGHPDGILVNSFDLQADDAPEYIWVDGSSAAAAHVAGVAALVISNYGRQTSGSLFQVLTDGSPQGETPRLDAFRALSRKEILISLR